MRKTFQYRLYPNRAQTEALTVQLSEACRLYNAALQERIEAYATHRKSINYYDQAAQLTEIRKAGDLDLPNCHCAQDVLRRLDKAFQAFFQRIKRGQKPGFPRFKSRRRYDSITFPSHGDGNKLLPSGHLFVQGVGNIKAKLHRPLHGKIKTVTVRRQNEHWYVCFSVEASAHTLPESTEMVGIDLNLENFATLEEGNLEEKRIENPRFYQQAQKKLRRAQRRVARRKKRSNRRRKAVVLLRKIHQHIFNQRLDHQHKLARMLVNQYGFIAVEDLNVKGLAGGMLSKQVHDASWASFIAKLAYKAEEAGRQLVKVDPRGTSQRCPCGAKVPKKLSDREHVCTACGLITTRDHASAAEILRLGLSLQAQTKPEVRVCVA
jgi:putative transposase